MIARISQELTSEAVKLQNRFGEVDQRKEKIIAELVALVRHEDQLQDFLLSAKEMEEDPTPFLEQLQKNYLGRAEAAKAMQESLLSEEAICRQGAEWVGRVIAEIKTQKCSL